jgi:hypothetical protein
MKKKNIIPSKLPNEVSYDVPEWAKVRERTSPPQFKEETISLIGKSGWITVDSKTKDRTKALEKEKRVSA